MRGYATKKAGASRLKKVGGLHAGNGFIWLAIQANALSVANLDV
jgi:hypothetical protein